MDRTAALNLRQRKFLKEYLKCGNASEACRRAGYRSAPDRHGYRLLRNVEIRKVLNLKWNQDRLLDEAEEFLRLAKEEKRIGEGKGVLELIAKVAGLLTEARQNPENRARDLNDPDLETEIRRALEGTESGAGGTAPSTIKSDRVH